MIENEKDLYNTLPKQEMIETIIGHYQIEDNECTWIPPNDLNKTISDILKKIGGNTEKNHNKFKKNKIDDWNKLRKLKYKHLKQMGFKVGEILSILPYIHWCNEFYHLTLLNEEDIKKIFCIYENPKEIIPYLSQILEEEDLTEYLPKILKEYENAKELSNINEKDLLRYGIKNGKAKLILNQLDKNICWVKFF